MNKRISFPYYSGNIKLTKCMGYVSLEQFINAHLTPTLENKIIFESIKVCVTPQVKRELKHQLFSFTPSVMIPFGLKRKYDNIARWTGLMQLDFDKLDTEEEAEILKDHLFHNYPQIVCAYLSPSRKGIKCLMRTTMPNSLAHYKAMHKAVENEMEQYSYFDAATSNAILPLFLSYDENILYRDYSDCVTWDETCWKETEYKHLNEAPPRNHPNLIPKGENDHNKTIRIFKNKIQNINDSGHPQVRSACLILGSRCGAGYITTTEATDLMYSEIKNSSYLSKGTQGYLDTANWALIEGSKNPKYYR